MVRGKRGSGLEEGIEMIPTLIVICLIAVVVFGISSSAYAYEVSVRDAEARLIGISIMKCLSSGGVLNLDEVDEESYEEVLDYCGIFGDGRVYIKVDVFDLGGKRVASFEEGDSGMLWVRDLVSSGNEVLWGNERVEKMVKYNPGYFSFNESVFVVRDGVRFKGSVEWEVMVNYE